MSGDTILRQNALREKLCEPGYVQVTYDVSENGNTRRLKYTTFQMHEVLRSRLHINMGDDRMMLASSKGDEDGIISVR
ncbi:hypothetical protein Tco_0899125 [Tanacetum coccineum]